MSEPKFIELVSRRDKGLNAYLAPEINGKVDCTTLARYGTPVSEADKQASFKGKKHTVKIRYDDLPDGKYVWKQAGGADFNKARYGWLLIKDGEVIKEG